MQVMNNERQEGEDMAKSKVKKRHPCWKECHYCIILSQTAFYYAQKYILEQLVEELKSIWFFNI